MYASCWRGLQQICAITCPVVVSLQILKQNEPFPVLQTEEICCDLIHTLCPIQRETFCFGEASFWSVLLKLCCCKLEMKAGFRGGLGLLCRGREREKCPTLFSPLPVRHSRGGRWQGHSSLSSRSVQKINVLFSLPDRFHHPPGHFNSFCKLEPFHQEILGVICSQYQEPRAWHCPENWETWV